MNGNCCSNTHMHFVVLFSNGHCIFCPFVNLLEVPIKIYLKLTQIVISTVKYLYFAEASSCWNLDAA